MKLRQLVTPRRLILAVVVLSLLFGLEGGEYGTSDWLSLRADEREEGALVAELTREVDSLEVVLRRLQRDPATQERVAREQFGMIREGEFLFRLIPEQGQR